MYELEIHEAIVRLSWENHTFPCELEYISHIHKTGFWIMTIEAFNKLNKAQKKKLLVDKFNPK